MCQTGDYGYPRKATKITALCSRTWQSPSYPGRCVQTKRNNLPSGSHRWTCTCPLPGRNKPHPRRSSLSRSSSSCRLCSKHRPSSRREPRRRRWSGSPPRRARTERTCVDTWILSETKVTRTGNSPARQGESRWCYATDQSRSEREGGARGNAVPGGGARGCTESVGIRCGGATEQMEAEGSWATATTGRAWSSCAGDTRAGAAERLPAVFRSQQPADRNTRTPVWDSTWQQPGASVAVIGTMTCPEIRQTSCAPDGRQTPASTRIRAVSAESQRFTRRVYRQTCGEPER